jgi:hypothetical protein
MNEYEKLSEKEREELHKQFLLDPDSFYRKSSDDQLKKNLQQNYKERFLTMTRLMKINLMLSQARISSTNTND